MASALTIVVMGGLFQLLAGANTAFSAEPARVELRQRLRAAVDLVSGEAWSAGSGPVGALGGAPLGAWVPAAWPRRLGARSADLPDTVTSDVVTFLSASDDRAAPAILHAATPPGQPVAIEALPPCPFADASCGFEVGESVLLVDGAQSDLFGIASISGSTIGLEARGPNSGRAYRAGSHLVPVKQATFSVRDATDIDGRQLSRYDGNQSDLPLLDHLVTLGVAYFGDPEPPRLRLAPGPGEPVTTYGPPPPPLDDDDPRDSWPAGENCIIQVVDHQQVARLPAWTPTGGRLVAIPLPALADGPWCPDASARARFDADLLRVRMVRISVRLEAAAWHRGRVATLFSRPGSAAASVMVPDAQWTFDLVLRAIGGGR